MKLTKENVYVNLQGKTKEELNEIVNFLESIKEETEENIRKEIHRQNTLEFYNDEWLTDASAVDKQEVTIEQLKEILQTMQTFTPIAMKCTQEQFEAIKPKLKGYMILGFKNFKYYCYIINNHNGENKIISNANESQKNNFGRTVHEEWNEEIFLKACGIEVETLQEKALRLESELKEVNKQIEEENKPKVGDYIYNTKECLFYKKSFNVYNQYEIKIKNTELINLLEQETKNHE